MPERWARRFHIVPLSATEQELVVATADPTDMDCERTLAFATGRHVRFALADAPAIARRIEDVYRGDTFTRDDEPRVEVQHLTTNDESAPPLPTDDASASISALVDELLAAGIAGRASDIHIEPEEQGIAVRHRVDGVLALARTLPRAVGPALGVVGPVLSGVGGVSGCEVHPASRATAVVAVRHRVNRADRCLGILPPGMRSRRGGWLYQLAGLTEGEDRERHEVVQRDSRSLDSRSLTADLYRVSRSDGVAARGWRARSYLSFCRRTISVIQMGPQARPARPSPRPPSMSAD